MTRFEFKITLTEATKQEAEEKIKSVTVLIRHLSARELKTFASIVQNDPSKVMLAKKYLGI